MSRVDELKQRLAAIGDIKKHQFTGTPFVKSNDDLTKMKTTHFLELAADKLGKPNTGSITGLADAHSNPSYDSKYFKGLERGDELGVVEQKKQNIRHKGKSGVPMLINWKGKNQITGHEGRHLGRALLEEGFDEIPVEFTEGFMNTDPAKKYKNTKNLIRQNKNKMPNLKDTRAPIFGRYSKLKQRLAAIRLARDDWDKKEDETEGEISGVSPRKDTYTGKPGVSRKERLKKMKERETFMKENPNATSEYTKRYYNDNLIYTPNDIIRFDEQFGSGIPSPRVEGFGESVPQKSLGIIKEPGIDYGKYRVTDEPVNVVHDIAISKRGESELSKKLEDKRIDSTLVKKRGEPETFAESFTRKFSHMKGVKKDFKNDPGKELKVNDYSQAVISGPNAIKYSNLKQRLSRLQQ